MKSHLSATIEESLVRELDRYSREEQRSRSQVIELALRHYLETKRGRDSAVVTTSARFEGKFERRECYDSASSMESQGSDISTCNSSPPCGLREFRKSSRKTPRTLLASQVSGR